MSWDVAVAGTVVAIVVAAAGIAAVGTVAVSAAAVAADTVVGKSLPVGIHCSWVWPRVHCSTCQLRTCQLVGWWRTGRRQRSWSSPAAAVAG